MFLDVYNSILDRGPTPLGFLKMRVYAHTVNVEDKSTHFKETLCILGLTESKCNLK